MPPGLSRLSHHRRIMIRLSHRMAFPSTWVLSMVLYTLRITPPLSFTHRMSHYHMRVSSPSWRLLHLLSSGLRHFLPHLRRFCLGRNHRRAHHRHRGIMSRHSDQWSRRFKKKMTWGAVRDIKPGRSRTHHRRDDLSVIYVI